jgi:D-amino-acid dehydrogenase
VCIAYELRKRGLDVVLIDQNEPGTGCSFGNSGAISSGSVVPLAMPGVLASVPGMLGRPDSPLFLPWHYVPRAMPWLLRFVWASRLAGVNNAAQRLAHFHTNAVALHQALAAQVGVPELIVQKGHLHLYPDQHALRSDQAGWRLREHFQVPFQRLNRDEVLDLEPAIPAQYQAGVFMHDQATVRNPFRYVQAIAAAAFAAGVEFHRANVQTLGRDSAAASTLPWQLQTTAGSLSARHVVVAAGAWSRLLLQPLGVRLALESQRGYHVQFQGGPSPVSRTVVLADRKVFITPMEEGVRVGGTVEFGGLQAPPNPHRAKVLLDIAHATFPSLVANPYSTWMGHRPCMPDSVPVVGPAPGLPGLWLATGHGHLGLTDSAFTGQLIARGIQAAMAE